MTLQLASVRGFNYMGSWAGNNAEIWNFWNDDVFRREVERGKALFPRWNLVRWWPSFDAHQRNPQNFLDRFEASLRVFSAHGIGVMPVLFNRWRAPECDFGGVCLEHILPNGSYQSGPAPDLFAYPRAGRAPGKIELLHSAYIEALIGTYRNDNRIVAWDLCNEPLMAPYAQDSTDPLCRAELQWLTWVRETARALTPIQPLTIGNCPNLAPIALTAPLSDFISFHPYYMWNVAGMTTTLFETLLDEVVVLAHTLGKEVLASETGWGALDDTRRATNLAYELTELQARRIGFIAQGLQYSQIADLHDPMDGAVDAPGAMYFVHADGRLRAGHDIYNHFC